MCGVKLESRTFDARYSHQYKACGVAMTTRLTRQLTEIGTSETPSKMRPSGNAEPLPPHLCTSTQCFMCYVRGDQYCLLKQLRRPTTHQSLITLGVGCTNANQITDFEIDNLPSIRINTPINICSLYEEHLLLTGLSLFNRQQPLVNQWKRRSADKQFKWRI